LSKTVLICFCDINLLSILQVFSRDTDKDMVVLLGARASRVENQDAIDACIVGMLSDPKEVSNFLQGTHIETLALSLVL
jgi:hypothetical protein